MIRSKNSKVVSKSGEAIISVKQKDKTVRHRAMSVSQSNIPLTLLELNNLMPSGPIHFCKVTGNAVGLVSFNMDNIRT